MRKDLTAGKPLHLILTFAIPMLMGMLFQQFYNLADTMIVGKLLGAQALAAVGSTGAINFLVIGFCMGLCNGFSIPVAQQVGANDLSTMRRFAANAAYLSIAFAVALTTVTAFFCDQILRLMQTPSDIFDNANRYIFIIFLGIPTTFLYNLLAGIIRALGDSKTPVYFLALSSILNIFLDFSLILWFHMGVAGAAVATVVSQGISGIACLFYMRKKFHVLKMTGTERRVDLQLCARLCYIGLPMGLQYSVTAGTKLYQLLCCPVDALGSTMAIYCGQNVGAGKLDRLGQGLRASAILGLCYSLVAFGAMVLFAPHATLLFMDPRETELERIISMTSQYIVTSTAFFFPLALVNAVRFSIQGMGFSVFAIFAGLLEMVARTVIALWFVPQFGFNAVCFASPMAWIAADLFLIPASMRCIAVLRRRLQPSPMLSKEQ